MVAGRNAKAEANVAGEGWAAARPEQEDGMRRCIYEGESHAGVMSAISLCGTFLKGVDPVTLTKQQDQTLPVCDACEAERERRRQKSLGPKRGYRRDERGRIMKKCTGF